MLSNLVYITIGATCIFGLTWFVLECIGFLFAAMGDDGSVK